jgi:hypothetical protein
MPVRPIPVCSHSCAGRSDGCLGAMGGRNDCLVGRMGRSERGVCVEVDVSGAQLTRT